MFLYKDFLKEMEVFRQKGAFIGSIGKSILSQDIAFVRIGNPLGKAVIITGGIHAREHITVLLCLCLMKDMLLNPPDDFCIYAVPCVNPDGFRLATEGITFLNSNEKWKKLKPFLYRINGGTDFSLWKANIGGVDLNVNFDAEWGKGKRNVFSPASENYVGSYPLDQPESKALADFTIEINPQAVIALHCKGEVIYWNFHQTGKVLWRDYNYAKRLMRVTGYPLTDSNGSSGGYKDWCIKRLMIPSVTIEVGRDCFSHPFPYEQFDDIYTKNKDILKETIRFLRPYRKEKS